MKTVESIIREVWTSKGPLKENERVDVPDEEAAYLRDRNQVIVIGEEAGPIPSLEGDDANEGKPMTWDGISDSETTATGS